MKRTGVLLMTFGAVESLDDLPQYYANIRGGRAPSPEQLADLRVRYERIGGRSPLVHIVRRQAQALERSLLDAGLEIPVAIGMRFWKPSIEDGVRALHGRGVQRIVGITSGPYDSEISVGSYERFFRDGARRVDPRLELDLVRRWYHRPELDAAWRTQVRAALDTSGWEPGSFYTLLSAHSLPERCLTWDDPYPREFFAHAARISSYLGLAPYGLCYQSAGLTNEPWLGPDILPALDHVKARGAKRVLDVPIGFSADHLEILHDLDWEASRRARDLGLEWARAPSLNDSPGFVEVLRAIVLSRLADEAIQSPALSV